MPRNGSGTYQLPAGNPVVMGTVISSTTQNTTMSDVATALTNSIAKDGQTTPTSNLPMGGFKHTGAGDATATGQYLVYGQDGAVLGETTMDGTMTWKKGADVASAAALPLIADGNYFDVTGTTTITSFASLGVGTWIGLHFDAALTLTHSATDLVLPGDANITTTAGDEAIFVEYASGDWRCISYTSGTRGVAIVQLTTGTGATYTPSAGTKSFFVEGVGGGASGGGVGGGTSPGSAGAGGGSGGGYFGKLITNMSQTFTYTIGAGGLPGTAGANAGNNGGDTTFTGSVTGTLTAGGGKAGGGVAPSATYSILSGVAGGTATGGDFNKSGGTPGNSTTGTGARAVSARGGDSEFGTGAIGVDAQNTATNGNAATEPGAGGSGAAEEDSTANRSGGAGFRGEIRIWEYK